MYAEDLPIGELLELGEHTVTRQEIVTFAAQRDPLPFHVDEFARSTRFGGVIRSGLHTMAIFQRSAARRLYRHWAPIAGRAISDVRLTVHCGPTPRCGPPSRPTRSLPTRRPAPSYARRAPSSTGRCP